LGEKLDFPSRPRRNEGKNAAGVASSDLRIVGGKMEGWESLSEKLCRREGVQKPSSSQKTSKGSRDSSAPREGGEYLVAPNHKQHPPNQKRERQSTPMRGGAVAFSIVGFANDMEV